MPKYNKGALIGRQKQQQEAIKELREQYWEARSKRQQQSVGSNEWMEYNEEIIEINELILNISKDMPNKRYTSKSILNKFKKAMQRNSFMQSMVNPLASTLFGGKKDA